ncbi:hypothetical protein CN071_27825 [Sinorhizobium meliloti]|uniref:hypothetical protein n=1 Tax=Rhizobium meliloti TaxID=382 RepID=UPI000FD9C299|nr:hypothetical protein [Sinorhizobium meliloti]RVP57113.1 hypothetical protein CN071_27825 [Sinorhizobium meliloti]
MNESQTLPDRYAGHRRSFSGGGFFILAVAPDGRGFRCYPVESGLEAEELNRDEMAAAIVELYGGFAPFRQN